MKRKIFYKTTTKLTNTEQYIMEFAEKNASLFASYTITELAKETNCSISSISKLSKKLAFKNFKEMQIWFNNEVMLRDKNEIIDNAETPKEFSKNIKNNYFIALERTFSDLNMDIFEKIKDKIKNKSVISFGIGSSKVAARELSEGLSGIGYFSKELYDLHSIFLTLNQKDKKKYIIFVFSNSAKHPEVMTLRKTAAKFNVGLVLITSNQMCTESKNEVIIKYRTTIQKKRIMALTSKISQLYIVDTFVNWLGEDIDHDIYNSFIEEWKK